MVIHLPSYINFDLLFLLLHNQLNQLLFILVQLGFIVVYIQLLLVQFYRCLGLLSQVLVRHGELGLDLHTLCLEADVGWFAGL